jgi:hypothetical protein
MVGVSSYIIFTSGIDYLFDDSKECTLVIRKVR